MNPEFEVYRLNPGGVSKARELAQIFDNALDKLVILTGVSGREVAIMRTKLEEACFFGKKALSKIEANQL